MRPSRTSALALVGLTALAGGALILWPRSSSAPDCPEGSWAVVDAGGGVWLAQCAPGAAGQKLPAGAALALGRKLDLNAATAQELELIPGVGRGLAQALVAAREAQGRFVTWDQVGEVGGVGAAKLSALQAAVEIR